ncbi:cilia- and flagella-associated protein 298 isoform X1 [Corvus cornix cornix]|uniref:cilia- and flagella-associated protein 298 isoform X1 n=1 Tax=Corvus cornix cornix TaxID=932674 RepID=UPI0019506F68|nr:cilia- and flagella-associated protein 298 isoform X1 [Corvus cornix cornix]XP_041893957.1 cilia- and flagella-associated protein 298-like isoform X2 [Corvus kubaryi]XP_048149279.1 cilia- and flagella-associated protein 298 isoform X2 [Corvus hawaiiensis]
MVRLHVKRGGESQFLLETPGSARLAELAPLAARIHNGRLKVQRLCSEMEELAEHGISLPYNMQGLADEQIEELKLKDEWAEKCVPSGGSVFRKDEMGRRNGFAPNEKMQQVIKKTVEEAKALISKAGTEVIKESEAQLWWAGKQLEETKLLSDYVGKNEKTTIIVKIQKKGQGAPGREPVISHEEQKEMMLYYYRKQEELKKLEEEDDDSFLNAEWADNHALKRQFHGVKDIKWGPR